MLERLYKKYLKNISEINKLEYDFLFERMKLLKKDLLLFFRKAKIRQYFHLHREQINAKQKVVMKRIYHSNKTYREEKIRKNIERYHINKIAITRTYDRATDETEKIKDSYTYAECYGNAMDLLVIL